MITLRNRLGRAVRDDRGLSLVEVIVAMMIFTIISTGLLYTMMSLLSVTRDSRSRQVAANLAAQEIDLARDVYDIFQLGDRSTDYTLNGDNFTVLRSSEWVTNVATSTACGAGGGTLRYKRVHVSVTWEGMRANSQPVETDTLINPNERISDPELGTILISVLTAPGDGVPLVPITAKLANGTGPTLTTTTDAQGCGYLLRVAPGLYNVSISSPGGAVYVDVQGVRNPIVNNKAVVKGTSATVQFSYDKGGVFSVAYGGGGVLPTAMPATLLSTRDPVVSAAANGNNPRLLYVYPWPDGYTVLAGDTVGCLAANPDAWAAGVSTGEAIPPAAVAAASGVTTSVAAAMGAVRVDLSGTGTKYVVAQSESVAVDGQPACSTPQVLRYAGTSSGNLTIALPFGSWKIYKSTTAGFTPASGNLVTAAGIQNVALSAINAASNVVTVDPRPAP